MPLQLRSTFTSQTSTWSMLQPRTLRLLLAVVHGTMATYFPCYLHYTDVLGTPLNHFKLPPGNQCWDYCKYHDGCKTYLVQLDDLSLCSLYEEDLDILDQVHNLTSCNIVGWKRCLLGLMGQLYLSNGQRWSDMANKEVVIRKFENDLCVSVDFDKVDNIEPDTSRYPLSWSPTCDGKTSWEFPTMETVVHDDVGCKLVVIRLKGTDMCLTSVFRNPPYSVPQAFLKRCRDDTETESSDSVLEMGAENQHLVLCPEKIENAWSLMLFRTYHPKFRPITLSSDDMDEDPILTLWNISLLLVNTPVSACKHVEVENGSVEIGEGVPLFLPGEKITVRCNEGFGVEVDHVIKEEYVTSCSEEIELDLCAPTQSDKDQQFCNQSGSQTQGIYFSNIEIWFVFCFVLFLS